MINRLCVSSLDPTFTSEVNELSFQLLSDANVTSPGRWLFKLTPSLNKVYLSLKDTVEFTFLPFTTCMFKFDQCKIFLAMINITILISLLVVLLGI